MTPERLRQVEEAFSNVIELPPDQRLRALEALCGTDRELHAEVESLLSHADPQEPFLADPLLSIKAVFPGQAAEYDELAGTRIGSYRILQRWASGGMGTVYLAERADGQFEQQVAIKVVKRGMDSEEILRRFAHERRMLATVNHPHIARLLDGGAMPDGRPYLVMEFVKGAPITQYCDEHRLSTDDRLRLFCLVCDAVRCAHQNLVVHRDLKPANILVDENGLPKLLDFGISKVLVGTGSSELTEASERRFTPEYASPEQVTGQPLSTATDIYSLGVILYELLTAHRPYHFKTRTAAEVERVVCAQEPLAPSAVVDPPPGARRDAGVDAVESVSRRAEGSVQRLRRRLSGDLDTIVLKAMQKDPTRRYASVDQFAGDLERHLNGFPVRARPDTARYRIAKFARRYRAALASTAVAAAVLVAAAGIALWQAGVARRERDAAYLARDQAEATADFLQRMLRAADPAGEGPETRVRTVLDQAAQSIETELRGRPLLQASIRSTIGRTYLGLGMLSQAEEHIQAAHQIRSARLDTDHHDLAESEFDLAHLLYAQGKFDEAEAHLDKSLATHRRLRGEVNLDTARVWNDLGAVRRAAGRVAEAEIALRRALEIREQLAGRESLDAAESLNNLAGVLRARGDFAAAEQMLTEVLATRRRLLSEKHPLVVQSIANLAVAAALQGDFPRGESLLRQAVERGREVYGPQHPEFAVDLVGLARMLIAQQRYAEAEPFVREALEIRRLRLTPNDERLLGTQVTLAECLVHQGRDAEAEPLLVELLELGRPNLLPGNAFWTGVVDRLEDIYRRSGNTVKENELRAIRSSLGVTE